MMNWFKKKEKHYKTWNDITYKQFKRLQEIVEDKESTEELQLLDMVLYLYGNKPMEDLWKYVQEVNQLIGQPMPNKDTIPSTVKVNGREYTMTREIENISTAQFIDYVSYCKNGNDLIGMLSCFIIPKGHKYGDGYDMEEVKNDIADLSVVDVQSYCFFFRKKWLKQQRISLLYLMTETLKLKGMPMKQKMKMLWGQATLYQNMDYLITSLRSSKNQD